MNGEEKPLYRVTFEDGTTRTLAELRRVGIVAQMVDPAAPDEVLKVTIADRTPVRSLGFAWSTTTPSPSCTSTSSPTCATRSS